MATSNFQVGQAELPFQGGFDYPVQNIFLQTIDPAPAPCDILWAQIKPQLNRYTRITMVPDNSYLTMINAPDGITQAQILSNLYQQDTNVAPIFFRQAHMPGWIYIGPSLLFGSGELGSTWAPGSPLHVRLQTPPVALVGEDELKIRDQGPYTAQGAPFFVPEIEEEEFEDGADGADKIPRPRNPWIIYRQEQFRDMQGNESYGTLGLAAASSIISKRWAAEPKSRKADYKKYAEEEKKMHAVLYPGYVYQPRRPEQRKRRMSKKRAKAEYDQCLASQIVPSIEEQQRVYKNALKYGIITPGEPFPMREAIRAAPLFVEGDDDFSPAIQEWNDANTQAGFEAANFDDDLFDGHEF